MNEWLVVMIFASGCATFVLLSKLLTMHNTKKDVGSLIKFSTKITDAKVMKGKQKDTYFTAEGNETMVRGVKEGFSFRVYAHRISYFGTGPDTIFETEFKSKLKGTVVFLKKWRLNGHVFYAYPNDEKKECEREYSLNKRVYKKEIKTNNPEFDSVYSILSNDDKKILDCLNDEWQQKLLENKGNYVIDKFGLGCMILKAPRDMNFLKKQLDFMIEFSKHLSGGVKTKKR